MEHEFFVVQFVRGVQIGIGGVILGMAALIVRQYTPIALKNRGVLPMHVALVAISYSLLIFLTAGTQFELLAEDRPATWRLWIVPPAYLTGIVALTLMLRDIRRRRAAGHVRRMSDP